MGILTLGPRARALAGAAALATLFCWPYLFGGKLLLPADSVLYLNEPWLSESPESPQSKGADPRLAQSGYRGHNYFTGDSVMQSYPWRRLVAESYGEGNLPLWNPYAFSGSPLAANAQSAPFYPFGFPLWMGDTARGFGWFAALHLVLLFFFTFLLLEGEDLRGLPAAAGALAFTFCGPVVVYLTRPEFLAAFTWIPLLLWGARRLARGAPHAGAALALGFGGELLAGHPQYAAYALMLAAAYYVAALVERRREGRVSNPPLPAWGNGLAGELAKGVVRLAIPLALGLGVAAIALIPMFEFLRHALRTRYEVAGTWGFGLLPMSLPLRNLVTFLLPDWFGNPVDGNYAAQGFLRWDNYVVYCVYGGVLPLVLAVAAVGRDRRSLFWMVTAAASLLMATGSTLYLPLRVLPGFDRVNPARFVIVTAFAVAMLAARGLARIAGGESGPRRRALVAAALIGLAALAALGIMGTSDYQRLQLGRLALLSVAAAAAVWGAGRRHLAWVPLVVLAGDLGWFGWRFNPRAAPADLFPATPAITEVRRHLDFGRLSTTRENILFPNSTTALGIPDVRGYDSFLWERYFEYCELIAPQRSEKFHWGEIHFRQGYASPLTDLLGVRLVLADRPLNENKFAPLWRGKKLALYRNERAFRELTPFSTWRVISEKHALLDRLASPEFEPRTELLLERPPRAPAGVPARPFDGARFDFTRIAAPLNQLVFEIDSAAPALVLVQVAGVPGWRAELDGRKIDWQHGDWIFPVVACPAGRHRLRMTYLPRSFIPAAALTMASLLAILVLNIQETKARRRKNFVSVRGQVWCLAYNTPPMSRPLRLEHPGAVWHVTSRGNARQDVFENDADRKSWIYILARVAVLYEWRLHAFVLMGNHYHLLIETPKPTLSRGMRQINGIYTQAFNRRHGRVGHLFQGRFKAILVQKESHLLELVRYVVLNPVRAGMVRFAREWAWSSYRMTAGELAAPPWFEVDWTLAQFGRGKREAAKRYRDFVSAGRGVAADPWSQVRGQIYLGSDAFVKAAVTRASTRTPDREIPRRQREPAPETIEHLLPAALAALDVTPPELLDHPRHRARERALLAYFMRRFAHATGKQLAPLLGVSPWRACGLAREGEKQWAEKGSAVRKKLEVVAGRTR